MDKLDLIYDIVKNTSSKVEKLNDKVQDIDDRTEINTASLIEHMKRSEANEKRLAIMEKRFTIKWVAKNVYSLIIGSSVLCGAIAKILGYV